MDHSQHHNALAADQTAVWTWTRMATHGKDRNIWSTISVTASSTSFTKVHFWKHWPTFKKNDFDTPTMVTFKVAIGGDSRWTMHHKSRIQKLPHQNSVRWRAHKRASVHVRAAPDKRGAGTYRTETAQKRDHRKFDAHCWSTVYRCIIYVLYNCV